MDKKWYLSKTLWGNVIAFGCSILLKQTGIEIDTETQVGALVVLNAILRLITKQGLTA
jgi:hypothetical protein